METRSSTPRRILVLCTGNSCRSQIAEALINHDLAGHWLAESAGTAPAGYVHPMAISVMQEVDIDLSSHTSKSTDLFRERAFDVILTVCDDAAENCPVWLGTGTRIHLSFADPARVTGDEETVRSAFRDTRDQIRRRVIPALQALDQSIHL